MPDAPQNPNRDPSTDQPAARDTSQPKRTPGTDMQAEDAGTPESGQPAERGTPVQPALKQTDKTEPESGSRG